MTAAARRFGVLILSHGRPDDAWDTIRTLTVTGQYSGPWWLVLDDEDDTADAYRERWGADRIVTFSKNSVDVDTADNGGTRAVVFYARNKTDEIARQLDLTHYLVLDDDYTYFAHTWGESSKAKVAFSRHIDEVCDAFLDFLDLPGVKSVAWSQAGDHIGGAGPGTFVHRGLTRKLMNAMFIRTGDPVEFPGRINEDVNAYVVGGGRGLLFFTYTRFKLNQGPTQERSGGMTAIYQEAGTYMKSMYTVIQAPSCVSVAPLGTRHFRFHHRVSWEHAVPKVVSGRHRKART